MIAPANDLTNNYELTGKRAFNSYVRKDNQTVRFLEPNKVYNELEAPLGTIRFTKFGQDQLYAPDEERYPLGGVTFNLYDLNGDIVDSTVSADGADGRPVGEVRFDNVPILGTYFVREADTLPGYLPAEGQMRVTYDDFKRNYDANTDTFIVSLTDAMAKMHFLNIKPVYGELILEKVNAQDTPLPYVRFQVEGLNTGNSDFKRNYLTDNAGRLTVTDLLEGRYRLTEIMPADQTSYVPLAPIEFTISKAQPCADFTGTNKLVNRSVQLAVHKVAVPSSFDPVADFGPNFTNFGLKKLNGYRFDICEVEQPDVIITSSPTANGYAIVNGLKIDTLYSITERPLAEETIYKYNTASYQFKINDKAQVIYVADGVETPFRQNLFNFPNPEKNINGRVEVEKLDHNGQPLAGARFGLYDQADRLVAEQTTEMVGARALAVFENLPSGLYRVRSWQHRKAIIALKLYVTSLSLIV